MMLDTLTFGRQRSYPPRVSAFTKPFWEGLAQGHWSSTCCRACGKFTFPPKPICPHCWSDHMEWKEMSTRGILYSWTRVHAVPAAFAAEAPYTLSIVDLENNLRVAMRLVEIEGVEVKPEIAVKVVRLMYEDGPMFAVQPVSV
jgi:uncharacterized OB-fold protein